MGQLVSYFKRRDNDDFESVLNELEDSIRVKEENLAFIKQREKRAIVYFTSYSILIWAVYALLWWFGALDWGSSSSSHAGNDTSLEGTDLLEADDILARIVKTLPVGAIPILIFFTRRIVKSWYTRKQNAENKQLVTLRKKQKDQIDKLKKLSNYDKITEMLERHGQVPLRSPLPGTPIRQGGGSGSKSGSAYSTPVGGIGGLATGGKGLFGAVAGQNGQGMTPAQQRLLSHQNTQQQTQNKGGKKMFPPPPPAVVHGLNVGMVPQGADPVFDQTAMMSPQPKTFIDKIADALLGGDEQSPASKYALICQKCFAHNGLVLKDEVMDVQFVCPRCGHFNPSRRSRMTGTSTTSAPTSRPSSSLSQHQDQHQAQSAASGVNNGSLAATTANNEAGDESMNLSSPTTQKRTRGHPLKSGMLAERRSEEVSSEEEAGAEDEEEGGDVSMDVGYNDGQETKQGEQKLTSQMNADERKEKLRRRTTGRKGESGEP